MTEKYWIGNSFFDFYFRRKNTWCLWGAIVTGYVLSIGYFLYAFNDIVKPEAFALQTDLVLMMGVLAFGFGLVFSLLDSYSHRSRRQKRNEVLRRAERSEPISSKHATISIYDRIKEGLDPEHTLVLKTRLGKQKVKVKDLPDNRVDFSSPSEMFSSLFSSKNE